MRTFQSVVCSVRAQVLVFLGNDMVSCFDRIVIGLENGHWPSRQSNWKSSQSNWKSYAELRLPTNNQVVFRIAKNSGKERAAKNSVKKR